MDYKGDIGKFVTVEFTRDGQQFFLKGILQAVETLANGRILLNIQDIAVAEKTNIVAEEAIHSYFARPYLK